MVSMLLPMIDPVQELQMNAMKLADRVSRQVSLLPTWKAALCQRGSWMEL